MVVHQKTVDFAVISGPVAGRLVSIMGADRPSASDNILIGETFCFAGYGASFIIHSAIDSIRQKVPINTRMNSEPQPTGNWLFITPCNGRRKTDSHHHRSKNASRDRAPKKYEKA